MNDRGEIKLTRKACEKMYGGKSVEAGLWRSCSGDYEENSLLGYNTRLVTSFHSSILLSLFDSEDGDDMFLRNVFGLIFNGLHGFLSHKTVFFTGTEVC
jgi:hypothetical protein